MKIGWLFAVGAGAGLAVGLLYQRRASSGGLGQSYYDYDGRSLDDVIKGWQDRDEKLYGPGEVTFRGRTLRAHGVFPISQVWKHREYTWRRGASRRSTAEWDELKSSMQADGLRDALILLVGRAGGAKVGEGNHRLAVARELGWDAVPVRIEHYEGRVTKSRPQAARPRRPRPRPLPRRSTPPTPAESAQIDELLELLNVR